jgi:hypothetical protein
MEDSNVNMVVQGDKLVITIDLKKEGKKSASGKSIVIASTHGNVVVPNTKFKLGLNLYQWMSRQ